MRIIPILMLTILAGACATTGPDLPSHVKSFPVGTLSGPLREYRSYHVVDSKLRRCFLMVQKGTSQTMVQVGCRKLAAQNPQAAKAITWPLQKGPARQVGRVKVPDDGPRKGSVAALVTIVVFSDLQCPFCGRVNGTLKRLLNEFEGKVAVVFRHLPLSFHRYAFLAATATMAAHKQGKFWAFHDKVFENYRALSRTAMERFAEELGLDMVRFRADLDSPEVARYVKRDAALAGRLGVRGTPSFFINGKRLVGAQPYERFKTVIESELNAAEALLRRGVKPHQIYARRVAENFQAPRTRRYRRPKPQPRRYSVLPAYLDAYTPVAGPDDALVTIVEFSDIQCPFCRRAHETMKAVRRHYGTQVRLAFRHLPLPFHRFAQLAAEATMAAHAQGKFWPYLDRLFANARRLGKEDLLVYAKATGLDMTRFKAALDTRRYRALVLRDKLLAPTLGANGTPHFFVNGRRVSGARTFAHFKQLIDEELVRAKRFKRRYRVPSRLLYGSLIRQLQLRLPAQQPVMLASTARGLRGVQFGKRNKRKVELYLDVTIGKQRALLSTLRRQAQQGKFQLVVYFVPWHSKLQLPLFGNLLASLGDRKLLSSEFFSRWEKVDQATMTSLVRVLDSLKLPSKRLTRALARLIKRNHQEKVVQQLARRGLVTNALPVVIYKRVALHVGPAQDADTLSELLVAINDLLR